MEVVTIDEHSTKRELLLFLTGISKNHVVAICLYINRCCDLDIPVYGNKGSIISALGKVDRAQLWAAVDSVLPDNDQDEDEDSFEEDEDDTDDEDVEDEFDDSEE